MATLSGIPVDPITGEPKDKKHLLALEKQEEEEQEESGFDPMRMAALQAGASLLRSSGPRYLPMSFGQAIGHAIPAGIQGYYQQDALNQQEQQAMLERQQAEQQALQDKQQVLIDEKIARDKRTDFEEMLAVSGLSHKLQTFYREMYRENPVKAFEAISKKMTEKKGKEASKFRILSDAEVKEKAPNLPTKNRTWKINLDTDDISEVTFKDEKEKGGNFRENILKVIGGKPQVRRVMFDADGNELRDLGTVDFEAAPDVKPAWDYKEKDEFFREYGNAASQLWPEGALLAEHNEQGHLKGFFMPENKYVPVGIKAIELSLRERTVDVQEANLELSEDRFIQDQENYDERKNREMMQQARENGWTETRMGMEKARHTAQMAQMARNYEDSAKYVTGEEFLEDNELSKAAFPKEVKFLELDKDGIVKKQIEGDFSTYVEPLNRAGVEEVNEEIKRLYKAHHFTQEQKNIIRGLKLNKDDPMEALKQAHAFLKEEEKLIQAPASILKKYQSDMGVARAAEEALAMINNPEEWAKIEKEVGFFYGQVTEKAKHPVFQKFKAIATMANLTKRHELIGSQMTDGELKFTEPLFVSDKDTADSLRVKLNTLLDDAKYNISLTRGMFSKEAGYNDAVWNYDPSKFWSPVDNQGNTTATSVEDIIKEAGEARGGQGPGTSGAESEPFDENTMEQ